MARGDAKRKIFFYRLLDQETLKPLDRTALCKAIEGLTGANVYYDDGEIITRAEVFSASRPQCIRFFKVRRDQLPGLDTGHGNHKDLGLAEEEGLAEAIHIRLFPNGVLAAESFGYGPRASRFSAYIRDKLGMPCVLEIQMRHDVVEEALKFGDIRLFRFKMEPSRASLQAIGPESLEGYMSTAEQLGTGVYAELVLRSEGGDKAFTDQIKGVISDLFSNQSPDSSIERVEVEGKPDPETPVASLDLLSEHLYRVVEIPLRTQRTRELDANAAFAALQKAYDSVKHDLSKDATAN